MKKLIHLILLAVLLVSSCHFKKKVDAHQDAYQASKMTIEEIEQKKPARFLSVDGKNRKNLFGQTVVKGIIQSTATVVAYKDIDVKLSFYSKTDALLEEDHEIIYETIGPGDDLSFKSKYFAPKGTTRVELKIVGASVAE
jgi:hypothetical protein